MCYLQVDQFNDQKTFHKSKIIAKIISPSISVALILVRQSLRVPVLLMMLRRHWVPHRLKNTRRLGLVAAGPHCLWTIVEMIARWSFHHHVENRSASHYLNCLLERQIRKGVTVAPHYHIARLQSCCSRWSTLSRSLFYSYNDKFILLPFRIIIKMLKYMKLE